MISKIVKIEKGVPNFLNLHASFDCVINITLQGKRITYLKRDIPSIIA